MLIQWRRGTEIMGEKTKRGQKKWSLFQLLCILCSLLHSWGTQSPDHKPEGSRQITRNADTALARKMWTSEEIHTLCWIPRLHCWIFSLSAPESCAFLFSGLMAACVSGVEAEAEVCCLEEAALVHRWGEPGAEGLPAGGPQLARSLLVQVCTEAGMFILWLFCPRKIWHFFFSSEVFTHLPSAAWRISNVCRYCKQELPKAWT